MDRNKRLKLHFPSEPPPPFRKTFQGDEFQDRKTKKNRFYTTAISAVNARKNGGEGSHCGCVVGPN